MERWPVYLHTSLSQIMSHIPVPSMFLLYLLTQIIQDIAANESGGGGVIEMFHFSRDIMIIEQSRSIL